MKTGRNRILVNEIVDVALEASYIEDELIFNIEVSPHYTGIANKLLFTDGGSQIDVNNRAGNHAICGVLSVSKLAILSSLHEVSSYRKGGVYYEVYGKEAMMLIKTMKDVVEAEVHRSGGQVLSSLEYLPEGWCKLSLRVISLFEFRWLSVTSNRMSILDPSLGMELLYAVYYVSEDSRVLDVVVQRLRHTYLVSMSIPWQMRCSRSLENWEVLDPI